MNKPIKLKTWYRSYFTKNERVKLAIDLAEALAILEEIHFVHGDVNPSNIFLNKRNRSLILIDFDSGAFDGKIPETEGKPGPGLAPELESRDGLPQISKYSDFWSLGVWIHYLLTLQHPYYFLKRSNLANLKKYLSQFQWPEFEKGNSFFSVEKNYEAAVKLRQLLWDLPEQVVKCFQKLFNDGVLVPTNRPGGKEWFESLREYAAKPSITGFSPNLKVRKDERPVKLSWDTSNAGEVIIEPEVGNVADYGSVDVFPMKATSYRLVTKDFKGRITKVKPVRIAVNTAPPIIHFFTPDTYHLKEDRPVRLSWSVDQSFRTTIVPDPIELDLKNSTALVNPVEGTTYKLVVESYFGFRAERPLKIKVSIPAPNIRFFACTSYHLMNGQAAKLVWYIQNASNIEITPHIGSVAKIGEMLVSPDRDTTYTLLASNRVGQKVRRELTITVLAKPINKFEIPPKPLFEKNRPSLSKRRVAAKGWINPESRIPLVSSKIPIV